jgi:hypothetical protein
MRPPTGPVGTCPTCGKQRFVTRSVVKAWFRKAFPAEKFNAYECDGYWHFGHQSPAITHGATTRGAKYRGGR